MASAQALCVTMYGTGQAFHNSLPHREVRHDATASLDGSRIGEPACWQAGLHEFLQPIGENLNKPQKEFLRDGLVGLLRAGRLTMSIGTAWPASYRIAGQSSSPAWTAWKAKRGESRTVKPSCRSF